VPIVGKGVEDELVLASRSSDPGGAQRPQVVADQILGPLGNPREIADAQLAALTQSQRERQPRRISQRPRARGRLRCGLVGELLADVLRAREV
jgi:hypothetical protein